jgi:hypothetical protein
MVGGGGSGGGAAAAESAKEITDGAARAAAVVGAAGKGSGMTGPGIGTGIENGTEMCSAGIVTATEKGSVNEIGTGATDGGTKATRTGVGWCVCESVCLCACARAY